VSSRPLLIGGIVLGALGGIALCVAALVVVAIDGSALSAQVMATLLMVTALGVVLDATWLTYAVAQLARLGGGDDDEGGEPRGGPSSDPVVPGPSHEGPDWWPEFERELRTHLEAREDAPVAG
jgi:hypothetical protein